jgi:DNA-binding NtrC family response regulator
MRTALLAWLGLTDLRAPTESVAVGLGPIAQAVGARAFDDVYLLSDHPRARVKPYLDWLSARGAPPLHVLEEKLSGPTRFGEIHEAAVRACLRARADAAGDVALSFHLSPGTPAMAAVWIILGKTRFPAELIESSRDHGVRTASVPFDISADFLPDLLRDADQRLRDAAAEAPPAAPEFGDILHRSPVMARLVSRARRAAARDVSVIIEGESGTGKELLARAIHRASLRKDGPFVPVNCGAIPAELVESELFGHEKGAFTGAVAARTGYFEAARGGTLFLDEIGELPLAAQVKLLRALQESEITRLGATAARKVDVRVIAATNRTLTDEIAAGRFREDLFYRLAVALLKLPPLRERPGDLGLLVDALWTRVAGEDVPTPGGDHKKLSAGARNVLLGHAWPGNVRELANTLRRAALWSDGPTITADEAREALLPAAAPGRADVLDRPLGHGLDLQGLLGDVARHYLQRAMGEAHDNKTRAAELVGLPSYQTLTNWLDKYGVGARARQIRARKSG